jgi:hypothetical protein
MCPHPPFSVTPRQEVTYSPLQIQRQEDDIRARVQLSSQAYHKSVQETQGLRQEYFNFQLPRILRVSARRTKLYHISSSRLL